MIKFWSYKEEYKELRKKILKSVDKSIKSGQIFFGKELQKFEKQFIKENNMEALVKVYTNVPNEKIKQFYLDHDVFILPATKEPAAISPLEAMGFGLPAICSNTNGTRYYIENNKTGIIFEDNSDKSLKRAINSLLDESEVHRMKENVRVVAKKNISKSNFYNSFIDIL